VQARPHHRALRRTVVEEIELDELDALVLEIEQRTRYAALRWNVLRHKAGGQRSGVAGAPIPGPVDPRRVAELQRTLAAAAEGIVFTHLAFETHVAGWGDLAEAIEDGARAGFESIGLIFQRRLRRIGGTGRRIAGEEWRGQDRQRRQA